MKVLLALTRFLAIAIGTLLTLVAVLWSLFGLGMPQCSTEPDDPGASAVIQVGFGGLIAVVVGLSVVAYLLVLRDRPDRHLVATIAALAYPITIVVVFLAGLASISVMEDVVSPGGTASNCF